MSNELENWREEIDALDKELLGVVAKRMKIVKKIGKLKKKNNIPPLDEKRWQKVMELIVSQAKKLGLSKDFIANLYALIHTYALHIEEDLK